MKFKAGQLVWVEVDQSAGPAKIFDDKDASFFKVEFLESKERRLYTKRNPPFKRVQIFEGQKVKIAGFDNPLVVESVELRSDLFYFKIQGQEFSETQILAFSSQSNVIDLLRQKKFTAPKLFDLRKDCLDLLNLRESFSLKGAAGCRVQLMPHQIYVLKKSLEASPIRALLADEVGLGKTIEAGLIFSALHAQKKLQRVLILVPPALKVQWLTECFRRFNVRFRLDHEDLIEIDEHRDFVISSLEELDKNFEELDLLIVDEAHRLVHDEQKSEKLEKLVTLSKNVLFLSATPQLHGQKEFHKLLKVLSLKADKQLPVKVFQSKRSEINLKTFRHLQAVFVKDKTVWLTQFLAEKIQSKSKDKVFVILKNSVDVLALHKKLVAKLGQNFALFHDKMDLVERDRQAAYFADPDGAQFLLSSEIGGEGRNFQFCHDLVLGDFPEDPLIVEQRIGRLDRIGQSEQVNVWCPILEESPEEKIFERLRDQYKIFERPWTGAGLEDLDKSEQIENTLQSTMNLEPLPFVKSCIFNKDEVKESFEALSDFEDIDVHNTLEQIYDVFGVEVEDFDTHGNLHVAASSLMFVESFPGLGESGEQVLCFDRPQALAREDMKLMTLDHPDCIETLEFFLNSEHGKLCLSQCEFKTKPDIIFCAHLIQDNVCDEKFWSYSKKAFVSEDSAPGEGQNVKWESINPQFLELLPTAFQSFSNSLNEKTKGLSFVLDSLKIYIPKV